MAIIPFQQVVDHILVDATADHSLGLSVVADTGSQRTLLAQAAFSRLKLSTTGTVTESSGYGGPSMPLRTTLVPAISFGNTVLNNLSADVQPFGAFEARFGHETDAIIGSDLFNSYVVEVDPSAKVLRLYDPASYRPPKKGCKVPLDLRTGDPTVHAELIGDDRKPIFATLLLDTGAPFALFTTSFTEANPDLPLRHLTVEVPTGLGANGTTKFRIGRLLKMRIGECAVDDPIAAFSEDTTGMGAGDDSSQGLIGMNVLRRFTAIFDYKKGFLFLQKRNGSRGHDEYNMSGLEVLAGGPGFHVFTVEQVVSNSPAALIGIRPGDKIESVDAVPASQLTLDDVYRSLQRSGRLRIEIRRGNLNLKVKLKLRPLV